VIVLTLVGVAGLALDAIREPSISFEGEADVSSPLSSPFTVTNKSSWFSMKNVIFICRIGSLKSKGGASVTNGYLITDTIDNVEAGDDVSFRCRAGTGVNGAKEFLKLPDNVISAHIFVRLQYRTLWFSRTSPEIEFTWFTEATPPRWIKGQQGHY